MHARVHGVRGAAESRAHAADRQLCIARPFPALSRCDAELLRTCPPFTVPAAEVKSPPSMLYSPLAIEMAGVASTPLTVIGADSMRMFIATGLRAANENAVGVESVPEVVVDTKSSLTEPTLSTVLVVPPAAIALVCRTRMD